MKLHPTDREALERALEIMLKDPAERARFEKKLKCEPRLEVCKLAASYCQDKALHLKLWQSAPCLVGDWKGALAAGNDGIGGDYAAARLVQRLLAAGLSVYEPDPISALALKERSKANGSAAPAS